MSTSDTRQVDLDTLSVTSCILYLLVAFMGAVWLLFDTWIDAHTLPFWVGYDVARLQTLQAPQYHIVVSSVAGGAIGGIVNGIRSALKFSENFKSRFAWKYISAPWTGAALALISYALLTTTAAVVSGEAATAQVGSSQLLSNFAIGALAGYGAKDVFTWLDARVHQLFGVKAETPNLEGKTKDVAISRIQSQNLEVGAVAAVPAHSPTTVGKVISQAPAPGTTLSRGDSVDFAVAVPAKQARGRIEGGSNGNKSRAAVAHPERQSQHA